MLACEPRSPSREMPSPPLRQHFAVRSALVALGTFAGSQVAKAYSGESVATDGCHERITMDALRRWRSQLPTIEIPAADSNERALIADAPFGVDDDLRDLAAVTTLLGNRDVDLKGHEPNALDELAPIHGDPRTQQEHCLRAPWDDEPTGSERALARCRDVIRTHASSALDGLTADGRVPDPARRLAFEAVLELRGATRANLP